MTYRHGVNVQPTGNGQGATEEDDWPQCSEGFHDFDIYDHPDGSVRNACRDCGEPADPEIIEPAPAEAGS